MIRENYYQRKILAKWVGPEKCRVKVGKMYFVRFEDMDVVMAVDDSPGSIGHAKVFDSFEDAHEVACIIGGKREPVEEVKHER